MTKLEKRLYGSGFSESQVKILLEIFALKGHSHGIEDVTGLDEELDNLTELACK